MAKQLTSLNFSTSGALYSTGTNQSRYLSTGDNLVLDLSQEKKVGGSFLNTDISATLYLDAFFGFEVWMNVGTTGTYSAEYDLDILVDLPNAVITPERAPEDPAQGAVMAFDFSDYEITRGEVKTVGFGNVEDEPDPVASSGLDLQAAFAAGIRDAGFYGPIPGGIDNFDLPSVRFFGFDLEKDLALLGLDNTILSRDPGDDPFRVKFNTGSDLYKKKFVNTNKVLKALGEFEFVVPEGASVSGLSNGSGRVEATGVSDTSFAEWSIDVDAFVLKLLSKIPVPAIQAAVKTLEKTVFLEVNYGIGDEIRFKLKVLDLTNILNIGVSENVVVDINRPGTTVPNVEIELVSDNGTPNDTSDDRTTTGRLGDTLYLLSPEKGDGTAKIDAKFSVAEARLSHDVWLNYGSYFRIDLLSGSFDGSLVPDALAFDFGPVYSDTFTIKDPAETVAPDPESDEANTLFQDSFTIPGSEFSTATETYEVFWVEERLAPNDWDPELPTFKDDVLAYFEAAYEQLQALFTEYDTTGYIVEPAGGRPSDLTVRFTEQDQPVLFGWTGAYKVRVLFDLLTLDGSRVLVGPRDPSEDYELTARGLAFSEEEGRYVEVVGPVAWDSDVSEKLELIDRFVTLAEYDYNGQYVQTNRTVDVIGDDLGDVLWYFFAGASDGYFDGGNNINGTYDTFIADLTFIKDGVQWDLAASQLLENDGNPATMGGVTIEMPQGHELTVKNVEAAVLKTGSGDDYLVGGRRSDYFDTGGGDDIVRLPYFVPGDRDVNLSDAVLVDTADDYVRLGNGRDTAVVEFGAPGPTTSEQSTDYVFGGEGADTVYVRSGQLGLRYDLFGTFGGAQQYLFGGKGLGSSASLSNIGVLVDRFNDDYVDNFGVFGDQGTRAKDHYLLMNGREAVKGGRIEISTDVEYVDVYTSTDGLYGEGTGRGNDLVIFMNGKLYDGGLGTDTFAGDFTSFDIYSGDRGGLQFWVDATASYFGDTLITGFERIWVTGTRVSDIIAGGALDDHIDGGTGNDFIFGGFDTAADALFGGAGDDTILWRNSGDDVLDAGRGRDTLYVGNFASPIDGTEVQDMGETGYLFEYYDENGNTLLTRGANFGTATQAYSAVLQMLDLGFQADSIGIRGNGDTLKYKNVEFVNMKGTDNSNDLMVYQEGQIYDAGERFDGKDQDAFFADFRFERAGIEITVPQLGLTPDEGIYLSNGVFIRGFESLLIAGTAFSDFLSGGEATDVLLGGRGDDVILGAGGNDYLDGGEGNDQMFWDSQGKDVITGGTNADGSEEADNLIINGGSGPGRVVLLNANGDDLLSATKGQAWTDSGREILQEVAEFSHQAAEWKYYNSTPGNPRNREDRSLRHVTYSEFETVDVAGTHEHDDLIVFQNGIAYVGGERDGDGDVFVADLRLVDDDLFFDGLSTSGAGYDIGQGTQIADFERFHVLTGSGNDRVIGGDFDDTAQGGNGEDWMSGGSGNDAFLGQGGNDYYEHSSGTDLYDGGAGKSDVLSLTARDDALSLRLFDIDGDRIGPVLSMETSPLAFAALANALAISSDAVEARFEHGSSALTFRNVEELLLSGSEANDVLIGGSLKSSQFGGGGNDALLSAEGKDFLAGGLGADIYALGKDFGRDVLFGETEANTRIVFTEYNDDDLKFSLGGTDLIVTVGKNSLRILDYFADDAKVGHNFTFETKDGASKRDFSDLKASSSGALARGVREFGSEDNDRPTNGTEKSDLFRGFGGDDFFTASGGRDVFDGGGGVDAVSYADAAAGLRLNLDDFTARIGDGRDDYLVSIERVLGTEFDDRMSGDTHQNALNGAGGNDQLSGNDGADTLIGGKGDDVLDGGGGDDTQSGDEGSDTLTGGDGDDLLLGGAGADSLDAGAGDDLLDGGAGNDSLIGGLGDDTLVYTSGVDMFDGAQGRDQADFTVLEGETLITLDGTVRHKGPKQDSFKKIADLSSIEDLLGSAGNDVIIGTDKSNLIDGFLGNDTLVGQAGDDEIYGGSGIDTVDYSRESGTEAVDVDLSDEEDQFAADTFGDTDKLFDIEGIIGSRFDDRIKGSDEDDELVGAAGDDVISGRSGDDLIDGGAGKDSITGGEGNDILIGGNGDDRIEGNKGDDTIISFGDGDDFYDGMEGRDIVSYERTKEGIEFTIGQLEATGSEIGTDKFRNVEAYAGGFGDDTVRGSGNGDYYYYLGGFDDFDARGGRDTLDFSRFVSSVLVDAGTDGSVKTADREKAPSGNVRDIMKISSIEDIRGSDFDDILLGNAANNRLFGGDGDDRLDGGTFDRDKDEIFGEGGNDVIVGRVGAGQDEIDGGDGSDVLDYSDAARAVLVSLEFGDGDDTVTSVEWLIGGDFNDTLLGDSQANILVGGGGRDRMFGGAGSDVMLYSAGIDTVEGGADSDTVDFSAHDAAVNVDLGDADSSATSGGKNRYDQGNQKLLVRLPELDVENAIGTAFDDRLRGNDEVNVLGGGKGNDLLEGLGGDDILTYQAGLDNWNGGGGSDTGSFAGFDAAISLDLGSGTARTLGKDAETLAQISNVENGVGTLFDDVLIGDAKDNTLEGLSGGDQLSGLAGDDTLAGSGGNDLLEGGAGADVLNGGEGDDTASYASSSAAVTVSLLVGTGEGGDAQGDRFDGVEYLTGSDFADTLSGDAGNNMLRGGKGNDALFGMDGEDTLEGGLGADMLNGGEGIDLASYSDAAAGVDVDLGDVSKNTGVAKGDQFTEIEGLIGSAFEDRLVGDSGENLLIGGSGNDRLLGGDGADLLTAGNGKDILDGGKMADEMRGGRGNDTYFVDDTRDGVFEEKKGGKDSVNTTVSFTLSAEVENLTLTSAEAEIGFGNGKKNKITGSQGDNALHGLGGRDTLAGMDGRDTLFGGAGNDKLSGGNSADMLDGGAGNDRLTGGDGGDVFVFEAGFGKDRILDFDLKSDVIHLIGGNGEVTSLKEFRAASQNKKQGVEYDLDQDGKNTILIADISLSDLAGRHFEFV